MKREGITVGVDLASDGVRLAAVQLGDGAPRVTGTFAYRWPPGVWAAGVIVKATVVREALRQAFADAGFPTGGVVLLIGGEVVNTVLEVPRMTPAELSEQIEWEAEQHVPFDVADMQLEYRVVGDDPDASSLQVLLSGFSRESVDAHLTVAREAGLQPRAVELEAEALRRLAVACDVSAADRTLAVIRASRTDAAILVLRGHEVAFGRVLPSTGPVDGVAAVRRTLDFFEATDGEHKVEQLLVAGPDAAAWQTSLRADASLPVERLLPGRIACQGGVGNLDAYATAIGLALPGPPMRTVGAPERPPGLWSKLTRMFRG